VLPHLDRLSPGRRAHSERVAALAQELAAQHGLDPTAAYQAGLAHDVARELTDARWLSEAARLGVAVGVEERTWPLLLHGPVAAAWLREAGMGTPALWEAVHYHTTGAPGLGPLAVVVYIADGTEPGRQYREAAEIREVARRDLYAGYRAALVSAARYLSGRGLRLHPLMLKALAEDGQTRAWV
jgi:predicted HD superfamily hydrolase involved in NAD metabolism